MHIILGEENIKEIDQKYTVLELDTLRISGEPVTAYCLIEELSLDEMFTLDQFRTLHENLIKNYKKRNWKFCEDAIEHLKGKWRGDLDTFYDSIDNRVKQYQQQEPSADWDGIIHKS
jgi:hypothetical protein